MPALLITRRALWALAWLTAVAASGCAKESVNCGHGVPVGSFRFRLTDDRTGNEWFTPPRPFSLDTLRKLNNQSFAQLDNNLVWSGVGLGNDYGVPAAGGDKTLTYFIRLNAADTDTITVHTFFGPVSESTCGYRYAQRVEVTYNGKLNGSYSPTSSFYCNGCGIILALRKRP